MLIARLLTPEEIGVFSVTMVLLTFVATVRDLGAGQYLIQEKDLTYEKLRAVWAVQLGLGFGLAAVVSLISHPISQFYAEPRIGDVMLVIAINYLVNPFGSMTYAWLMREMQFEKVALMRFSSSLIGVIISGWLAWKNFGPISLAVGALASTSLNALIAVYFRPKWFPWMPGFTGIRGVLKFGSQLTGSSIVNVISSSAPDLLLGKLQGLISAGLFSRALGLVHMFYRLFVDAVGAVCLPWFAKHSREHGDLSEPFLRATAYVTALGWSFCIGIICLAHPIIRTLYGFQWDHAVDLARLLAIATAFSVPASLCPTALLSAGAVSVIARVSVLCALQTILLVAIGASQSMMSVGIAMILAAGVSSAIWLRTSSKRLGFSLEAFFNAVVKSAVVAMLSGIGPLFAFFKYGAYPDERAAPIVLGCALGLMGFVGGILMVRHPLKDELTTLLAKLISRTN